MRAGRLFYARAARHAAVDWRDVIAYSHRGFGCCRRESSRVARMMSLLCRVCSVCRVCHVCRVAYRKAESIRYFRNSNSKTRIANSNSSAMVMAIRVRERVRRGVLSNGADLRSVCVIRVGIGNQTIDFPTVEHVCAPVRKMMVPAGRSHILCPCSDTAVAKLATGTVYDSSPSESFISCMSCGDTALDAVICEVCSRQTTRERRPTQ